MTFEKLISFGDIIVEKIPGLQLGILEIHNFKVSKYSESVQNTFHNLFSYIENKYADVPPSSDQIISAVRRMYRRIGWEPTRYRPSSEAMIRRILKRKGLYNINNAVDLGNVASTWFHLPMGLYDMNKIDGKIEIDVGKVDETYKGLSIDLIHAEGKLILRDNLGIFGNPTADSERTCINSETKEVMAIFFTPPEVERIHLEETLNYLTQLYTKETASATFHSYIIAC
jgi:DNA/RNA-binding domain of Phe-tRNA-synthetase-like protein